MAALTTSAVTQAGTTITLAAAGAGGDTIVASASTWLHVKNASGASITVTVDDPTSPTPTAATAFNPDAAITVAASAERLIGPISSRFANATTGLATVTYSSATSITVGAFSL
jgi:hypothetical protein